MEIPQQELPPQQAQQALDIYRERYGELNPMEFVRVRTADDLEMWGKIQDIMVKFLSGMDLQDLLSEEETKKDEALVETVLRTFKISDITKFDAEKVASDVGEALESITSKLDKTDTYQKFKSFDSLYRHNDNFFKPFDDYVDKFWPSKRPLESDFVVVFAKSIKESTGSSWEVAFRLAEKIKAPMLDSRIKQALTASETNLEDLNRVSKQPIPDWFKFFSLSKGARMCNRGHRCYCKLHRKMQSLLALVRSYGKIGRDTWEILRNS